MLAFTKIERTKPIAGCFLPAFINNGGQYFFANLEVFEDGRVDAWELVDLQQVERKINSGWIATTVPDGKDISIHGVGQFTIDDCSWLISKAKAYEYIKQVVQLLNPSMLNIYQHDEAKVRKVGHVVEGESGNGKPVKWRKANDRYSGKWHGDNFFHFLKKNDEGFYLCHSNVFADGTITISGIPNPIFTDVAGFMAFVDDKKVLTFLPENSHVEIYGLGTFTIKGCKYFADINDKAGEFDDMVAAVNGSPTTGQICSEIYDQYLATPTVALRAALKEAYEKIPKSKRIYVLGDMDVKDIPVRMIIYGDNEIEHWSHYEISKSRGMELPEIFVPKPIDE